MLIDCYLGTLFALYRLTTLIPFINKNTSEFKWYKNIFALKLMREKNAIEFLISFTAEVVC